MRRAQSSPWVPVGQAGSSESPSQVGLEPAETGVITQQERMKDSRRGPQGVQLLAGSAPSHRSPLNQPVTGTLLLGVRWEWNYTS